MSDALHVRLLEISSRAVLSTNGTTALAMTSHTTGFFAARPKTILHRGRCHLSRVHASTRLSFTDEREDHMEERSHSVCNLEELHKFVHETLCESENLLSEQFRTAARGLMAKNQLCGMEFSLHGLRSIRLGAIWSADQNVLYFYNASGERYLKVQLTERFPIDLKQSA